MSEENIHVDTLVTEDMSKDELYDYAKYLEYRKEELLNINSSLQQKVEQLEKELKETNNLLHKANDEVVSYCNRCIELENIRKEAIDFVKEHARIDDEYPAYIEMLLEEKQDLLNILNKGSDKE